MFKNIHFLHAFNLAFMNLPLSRDPEMADAFIDKGALACPEIGLKWF